MKILKAITISLLRHTALLHAKRVYKHTFQAIFFWWLNVSEAILTNIQFGSTIIKGLRKPEPYVHCNWELSVNLYMFTIQKQL